MKVFYPLDNKSPDLFGASIISLNLYAPFIPIVHSDSRQLNTSTRWIEIDRKLHDFTRAYPRLEFLYMNDDFLAIRPFTLPLPFAYAGTIGAKRPASTYGKIYRFTESIVGKDFPNFNCHTPVIAETDKVSWLFNRYGYGTMLWKTMYVHHFNPPNTLSIKEQSIESLPQNLHTLPYPFVSFKHGKVDIKSLLRVCMPPIHPNG
jgi:hypothetical protein